ncbi:histidine kinase [Chryseolinea sp. T2]|uniref:sensor histidine kinase n=1 Tax=Chryseolinea sp. T2 TaxID=3129255 RepID=UPI0030770892
MKRLNEFLSNDFIFSPRYRVWRHVIYWSFHVTIWATFWLVIGVPLSFGRHLLNMTMWVPVFILFSYPLVYGAIPHLLLKGRVSLFFLVMLAWGAVGLFIDAAYRSYVLIPVQEAMGLDNILPRGPLPFCYLCMTTSAASPMIIRFFKLCTLKQREWMQAQKEKVTAELQLLKAQVHPHFLFNTLNNIYSFSMDNSPKTPGLILKLSSLLSYMLYECDTKEVFLEKEMEVMKNYIDLERERYGSRLDISFSVQGDVKEKLIAPLLLLPFLENAFKHGISQQIGRYWLSVDVLVKNDALRCKIINSKNEYVAYRENGIGIRNVRKRLQFLYPGKHELKISDEGNFFVVSMAVKLVSRSASIIESPGRPINTEFIKNEDPQPAY